MDTQSQTRYKSVYLVLTNDCNSDCSFCYSKGSRNKQSMSKEVIIDSIKFIYSNLKVTPNFYIFLWGGEPFLNFDVTKYAIEKYPQVMFHSNTNGSLITEDVYNYLIKNNNYRLVWSMGDAYEKYGSICNKVEAQPFTKKLFLEKQGSINFLVTNYDNMVEDYRYLANLGFININCYYKQHYDFTPEEIEKYITGYLEIIKEFRLDYKVLQSSFWNGGCGSPYETRKFCGCGLERLAIDPEGGIWQCDGWYTNKDNQLGDIYKGIDWNKLDLMKQVQSNKDEYMFKYCKGCNIRYICPNTKCLAGNYRKTGGYFKPYPGFCSMNKGLIRMFNKYKESYEFTS